MEEVNVASGDCFKFYFIFHFTRLGSTCNSYLVIIFICFRFPVLLFQLILLNLLHF